MSHPPPNPHPSIPPPARRAAVADAVAPDGSEIRLLLDERHGAGGGSMVEAALPPGQVSRPVYHRTVAEMWYILEGYGQVWRCPPDIDPAGIEPMAVQPGDALTIPVGWRFQFIAAADSAAGLRFLCITIPPWPGAGEAQPANYGGLGPPTI